MNYRIKQTSTAANSILRRPSVESRGGVVSTQHRRASEIGTEVLRAGGNACDAAVAVSFVLGVLEPWMSGPFGGGAMMVAPADAPVEALYYGMRAPKFLDPADYPLAAEGRASDLFPWAAVEGDRNVTGPLAIAVPGTAAGIGALHDRHGTMPWAELLLPAVQLAREGMLIDWYAALMIASHARSLSQDPDAAAMFLQDGTWPRVAGWTALSDMRVNMDRMGDTLAHLSTAGWNDFYRGDLARTLVSDLQAKGNRIVLEDLESYRAEWQTPLAIAHNGGTFHVTPHLTAGPTLADMLAHLGIIRPVAPKGPPGAADYVAWAESLRFAYSKRLSSAGDPPVAEAGHDAPNAPACTTHFAVVDGKGNMVSMTQTLLSGFGSSVVSQSTGLLMNNGIMWFDPEPGRPNSIGPGKRCLMNICPAVVDKDGQRMALGASGGRKILSAVAQVALMMADHDLTPDEAIHTPRIDVSGGPTLQADAILPTDVLQALGADFDTIAVPRSFFPLSFACPVAVARKGGINSGICEITMPWAEAVAEF
ncbi:gamma-glutamyltransferase [Paracoccus liaowanqingii]|uniref:Gamma-glutamyltransferase n=1 Tax=Paracoccus liaowanqingii TaxID=2560053 RepID=A0A4Z1CSH2_9RHOB|nr:gamma-glutamyltransferase [Paracoccus liaowanqingii]TGN68333.1 gamma-glutamyltransferase [Paracoccus liaowanqingii]